MGPKCLSTHSVIMSIMYTILFFKKPQCNTKKETQTKNPIQLFKVILQLLPRKSKI